MSAFQLLFAFTVLIIAMGAPQIFLAFLVAFVIALGFASSIAAGGNPWR